MASGNTVKLNIGGTVFQTTKSTLTKFDGFFKTMLETGVPLEKDETGAILVDRSPEHFELILNFMRDGDAEIPTIEKDRREIMKEAQYYLLSGLVELCQPKMRTFNGFDDIVSVLTDCRKKGVINIYYAPNGFNGAARLVTVRDRYDEHFDVFPNLYKKQLAMRKVRGVS